jgi:hypothetical protein
MATNDRLHEWLETARTIAENELRLNAYLEKGYMEVEGYDVDPTDHSGSVDINGTIAFQTVYDQPEMDYFNGTGALGGLRMTKAVFDGTITVKDENETVIYEDTITLNLNV